MLSRLRPGAAPEPPRSGPCVAMAQLSVGHVRLMCSIAMLYPPASAAGRPVRYTCPMRPEKLGRALGIGVRLASQRILPAAPPAPTAAERQAATARRVRRGEALGHKARRTREGGKRLGRAVWNPFATATGTLWYEITGMFFALFALFFGQHMWSMHTGWRSGPQHRDFLLYAMLSLLFAWFAISSFRRARKRARLVKK